MMDDQDKTLYKDVSNTIKIAIGYPPISGKSFFSFT